MTIHFLNGFTATPRLLPHWKCGTLDLLIETNDGLVLVDTGLGLDDYVHHSGILKMFLLIGHVPLDPQAAVINQVQRLGYKPHALRPLWRIARLPLGQSPRVPQRI
jgi:hypothetical protein